MKSIELSSAHRILSPRPVFLIGARHAGEMNIIPVSNVTSLSVDPELFGVGIYKEWSINALLAGSRQLTLSSPPIEDAEMVWKMGARYSDYSGNGSGGKIPEFLARLDTEWSPAGPTLRSALARAECRIVRTLSDIGDHIWYVAEVVRVEADAAMLDRTGQPVGTYRPVMQVVGNWLTTAAEFEQMGPLS